MRIGFDRKLYFTGSVLFLIGSVLLTIHSLTRKNICYLHLSGMIVFDIGSVLFIIDSMITTSSKVKKSKAHSNEFEDDTQNVIVEVASVEQES